MFRMNGYVQDERYIAREHMDVRRDCFKLALRLRTNGTPRAHMFRMNGTPRAQDAQERCLSG